MKICTRITLGALSAAMLAACSGCKEESKAPPPPPPPPAAGKGPDIAPAGAPSAVPTAPPTPTQAGAGTIEGSVTFAGTPPEMKNLPTAADAKCPKLVKNEEV